MLLKHNFFEHSRMYNKNISANKPIILRFNVLDIVLRFLLVRGFCCFLIQYFQVLTTSFTKTNSSRLSSNQEPSSSNSIASMYYTCSIFQIQKHCKTKHLQNGFCQIRTKPSMKFFVPKPSVSQFWPILCPFPPYYQYKSLNMNGSEFMLQSKEVQNGSSITANIMLLIMDRQTQTESPQFDSQAVNHYIFVDCNFACKLQEPDHKSINSSESLKGLSINQSKENSEPEKERKPTQSKLHNCPKHLIKVLTLALELNNVEEVHLKAPFDLLPAKVQSAISGLLNLLLLTQQNKIRSTSKQLLKLIFETNAQQQHRLTLLNNPYIRNFFSLHDCQTLSIAKQILRAYTADKLTHSKSALIDASRITRKDINSKYLDIFIRELNCGVIKERISKVDKLRILDECGEDGE